MTLLISKAITKIRKKQNSEPGYRGKRNLATRERLSHLTLPLTKERLSVLPDFLVPDVLNLYVPFTVQTKPRAGTLKVKGKEAKINSPLDAMKLGMAYLPEDRKAEGIIADLSVRENIIIALQAKRGMFHPLSKKEMEEAADKYIKLLQIKTASRETPIKSLSGGNQQKVILGRWLLTNPDYLILDEPTTRY